MGLNTVVMLCNDHLHDLEKSPREFCQVLYRAVQGMERGRLPYAGAQVISICHSGETQIVAVGGNRGAFIGVVSGDAVARSSVEILKELADHHGYYLAKKPKGRTHAATEDGHAGSDQKRDRTRG